MNQSRINFFDKETALILPNNRAVSYWFEHYRKNLRSDQPPILDALHLLSYSDFCRLLLEKSPNFFSVKIISDQEAFLIILRMIPTELNFIERFELARSIVSGIKLMIRWDLSFQEFDYYYLNERQRFFKVVMNHFKQWMEKEHIMTIDYAIKSFIECQELIDLPFNKVKMQGFDDFYPLQKNLFNKLKKTISFIFEEEIVNHKIVKKFVFDSFEDEYAAALDWLMKTTAAASIVVLDMTKDFEILKAIAIEKLSPHLNSLPLEQVLDKVSFSSGLSLFEYPLVQEIFSLLEREAKESIYLNYDLFSHSDIDCINAKKNLFDWKQFLLILLQQSQWCQIIQLTSIEYQVRQAFLDQLDNLALASGIIGECSYKEWIFYFKSYLKLTIFQPQSIERKKTVMGLLEAAPLNLDGCWLIGADNYHIPQSLQPHPLIPVEIQEKFALPHAHLDREMGYLSKILKRLSTSFDFQLSYSRKKLDEQRHYSPMLDLIFPGEYLEKSSTNPSSIQNFSTSCFENSNLRHQHFRVSVSQLNQFLICPFKGFAAILKGSQKKIETILPITAANHGHLVHGYLQNSLHNKEQINLFSEYAPNWPIQLINQEKMRLDRYVPSIRKIFSDDIEYLQVEKKVSLQLNGWLIEGRADLWDPVQKRVFDIKSKGFIVSSWFNEKLKDIQGAVYVLSLDAKSLGLIRLQDNKVMITDENIEYLKDNWIDQLKDILRSWQKGDYRPQPQDQGACHQCSLKKACRYEAY